MKILIAVGPALGILNHTIALSHLLAADGHEIFWITSPASRKHLEDMEFPYTTFYLESHDINFDRGGKNRLPHLQQVCDYEFLLKSLRDEISIVNSLKPDLLITKHYYSIPILSRLTRIPFVTYFTDGPVHLIDKNPQVRVANVSLTENVNRIATEFGVDEFQEPVPHCITSPYLNIVRGLAETSGLSTDELGSLPSTTAFCGLLTYDGPIQLIPKELPKKSDRPLVYITYGTVCYDLERYRITTKAVTNLDLDIILTTMHLNSNEMGIIPSNVYTFRYVPNEPVFAIADVVIHHGGHGTMLGALAAGVPQIIIPDNITSTNQSHHASTIEQLGIGVYLRKDEFSSESLRQAIFKVLSGSYRPKAEEFATELKQKSQYLQAQLCKRVQSIDIA